MNSIRRDAIVGLTALLGVIGLGATLMLFGEFSFLRPERYTVTLVVPDARGIGANAPVTLNGVKVGRVTSVSTGVDPSLGVTLELSIDNGVRVPRDIDMGVQRGLLGESTLTIAVPMRGLDAAPLPDDAFIAPNERLVTQASGAFEDIADRVESQLASFKDAAQSVEQLADTYTAVGEELRTLLNPDGVEGDVSIRDTIARFNRTLKGAEAWLGDESLRTEAQAAVADARTAFQRLDDVSERFGTLADTLASVTLDAGEDVDEGVKRFVDAANAMSSALEEVRLVALRVNEGEGTVGQLLNNPDLYRNLNDAAKRLDKALLEAQLLIEKYRREGVPIQF